MKTTEFEKVLKDTVDPTINFRKGSNPDVVGIYWGDLYVETAIPSEDIYAEKSENYLDLFGFPHRGYNEATEKVKGFIERYNSDPDFRDLYAPDEDTIPEQA